MSGDEKKPTVFAGYVWFPKKVGYIWAFSTQKQVFDTYSTHPRHSLNPRES